MCLERNQGELIHFLGFSGDYFKRQCVIVFFYLEMPLVFDRVNFLLLRKHSQNLASSSFLLFRQGHSLHGIKPAQLIQWHLLFRNGVIKSSHASSCIHVSSS